MGADTALTRAQTLTPACTKDIQAIRRTTWIPLVNAGVQFAKDKNTDSAVVLYHQANLIYQGEPNAFTNLGVLYSTTNQPDSAIVYFQKAVNSAGTDAKGTDARDQAQYNLSALLSNQGRWPEAVAAWQQYLKWKPDDADAKKAYARALRASGQPDAAAEIERGLIATGSAEVSNDDLMTAGVNFFNDKNYAEAAETFGRVVQREPWNRDALFNQANAYLGAGNGPELVKTGTALHAIDPMNESSLKLLAQGYQLEKNQDMTIKLYTELEALPFSITVDLLTLESGGAKLSGKAVGRAGAHHRHQADREAPGDGRLRVHQQGHGGGGHQRAGHSRARPGGEFRVRGRRPGRGHRRLALSREVGKWARRAGSRPGRPIDTSRVPGRFSGGCGRNSVGRMPASQAGRRRFESGRPLCRNEQDPRRTNWFGGGFGAWPSHLTAA